MCPLLDLYLSVFIVGFNVFVFGCALTITCYVLDSEDSRMSRSRNVQPQKSSVTGTSLLGLRSPFASLFSFRKSIKQSSKPQPERHGIFSTNNEIPSNTEEKKKFGIYQSSRVKQLVSLFEPRQKKEDESGPANAQLQKEVYQVLGDLDQKLAQEHGQQLRTIRRTANYIPGSHDENKASFNKIPEARKGHTRNSYSQDEYRTVPLEGTHKTHATYQPRKFYDMYFNRHRTTSKQQKNEFEKSPSWCSALGSKSISPSTATSSGSFSSSSLQYPSLGRQNDFSFERTNQQMPKRTPISSIKWENQSSAGNIDNHNKPFRTQSAMDLTKLDSSSQQNRMYSLYKNKNSYIDSGSNTNDYHRTNYKNDSFLKNSIHNAFRSSKSHSFDLTDDGYSPSFNEENKENTLTKMESSFGFSSNKYYQQVEPMEISGEIEHQVPLIQNASNHNTNTALTKNFEKGSVPCFQIQSENNNVTANSSEKQRNADNTTDRNQDSLMQNTLSSVHLNFSCETKNIDKPMQVDFALKDQSKFEIDRADVPNVCFQSTDFVPNLSSLNHTQQNASSSRSIHIKNDLPSHASEKSQQTDNSNKDGDTLFSRSKPKVYDFKNSFNTKTSHGLQSSSIPDNQGQFVCSNIRDKKTKANKMLCSDMLRDQSNTSSSLPDLSNLRIFATNKRKVKNYTEKNGSTVTQGHILSTAIEKQNDNKTLSIYPVHATYGVDNLNTPFDVSYNVTNHKELEMHFEKTIESKEIVPFSDGTMDIDTNTPKHLIEDNPKDCDMGVLNNHMYNLTTTIDYTNNNRQSITLLETSHEQCKDYYVAITDTIQSLRVSVNPSVTETANDLECSYIAHAKPLVENHSKPTTHEKKSQIKQSLYDHLDTDITYQSDLSIPFQKGSGLITSRENNEEEHSHIKPLNENDFKSDFVNSPFQISNYVMPKTCIVPLSTGEKQDTTDCPSEPYVNQNLILDVHKYTHTMSSGSVDSSATTRLSTAPVAKLVEEHFQTHSSNQSAIPSSKPNKSINLLKEHLLLAPEPYKTYTSIKNIIEPQWNVPESFKEEVQSVDKPDSPISKVLNVAEEHNTENKTVQSHNMHHSTITRTHVYEKSSTSSKMPDSDTIEYHKFVSIYCSLPRKYSKPPIAFSENNMRNIDMTLENSKAPSALLEKNRSMEYKENILKTLSPQTPETVTKNEFISESTAHAKSRSSSFPITSLQTNLSKKSHRVLSNEDIISPVNDLVDMFGSLKIAERKSSYNQTFTDLNTQKNYTNEDRYTGYNNYNDLESPAKHKLNFYCTLPNRKSNLKYYGKSPPERDVTNAYERPIYSPPGNVNFISQGSKKLSPSKSFGNDNLSNSPIYDLTSPKFTPYGNDTLRNSPIYDFMHSKLPPSKPFENDNLSNSPSYEFPSPKFPQSKTFGNNNLSNSPSYDFPSPKFPQAKQFGNNNPSNSPSFDFTSSKFPASKPFGNDNLSNSPSFDFTSPTFFENEDEPNSINSFIMRDTTLLRQHSNDGSTIPLQKCIPHSKSFKDFSSHGQYNNIDYLVSPYNNYSLEPLVHNQSNVTKVNEMLNRTKPSVFSKYNQNDINTQRNARQYTFSFDNSNQREFNSLRRKSSRCSPKMSDDPDSPPMYYSTNPSHSNPLDKSFYGCGSPVGYSEPTGSPLYRSKSLKVLNFEEKQDCMDFRCKNDQQFSSKSYGGKLSTRSPSSCKGSSNTNYSRRFSSENIIDENENWPSTETSKKPVYTSKSLDYGIFGKEQQEAFLKNIKRTLTEGRLWRPSFLKYPGVLRNEDNLSSGDCQVINSSSQLSMLQEPTSKMPLNIYNDRNTICSDSDNDTTTDDEYYLDENDKESEL
ncbi:exophilin-5 isoform X2 [Bombina bombina]|uniref:exophilin-5 isoform X2 n=1 Tax=Bombina bombina TaxID=8345 RepID=UPI00235A5E11|nr:exophilin-5 isoform X2 [Bombina bombina]